MAMRTMSNREQSVREAALAALARRSHSRGELAAKLVAKGFGERDIEDTLDWLAGLGYLDDPTYARERAEMLQSRGYGRFHIRGDLRSRGVESEVVQAVVDRLPDMRDTISALIARYMAGQDADDPRQRRRVSDALARRGFSWDEIDAGLYQFFETEGTRD